MPAIDGYELTTGWLLHRRVPDLGDEELDREQAELADFLDRGLSWTRKTLNKIENVPGVSNDVRAKARRVAIEEVRRRFATQKETVEAAGLRNRLNLLEGEILAPQNLFAPNGGDPDILATQTAEAARLLRAMEPLEVEVVVSRAITTNPPDLAVLRAVEFAPPTFPIVENEDLLSSVRESLAEKRFPEKYAERRRLQLAVDWRRHTWGRTMQHLRELTGVEFPVDVDPIPIQAGLEPTEPEENPVADAVAQSAMSE